MTLIARYNNFLTSSNREFDATGLSDRSDLETVDPTIVTRKTRKKLATARLQQFATPMSFFTKRNAQYTAAATLGGGLVGASVALLTSTTLSAALIFSGFGAAAGLLLMLATLFYLHHHNNSQSTVVSQCYLSNTP